MHLKKLLGILFMSSILSACGGDSDDSNYSTPTAPPSSPIATKIVPSADGKITISGQAQADSTITVNLPDGTQKTTKADSEGKYTLTINSPSAGGEIKITSTNSGGDTSKPTTLDADTVTKTIYQSTGKMPDLAFSPSLGINTEAPQGGVDTVGQAMPFVDVFRTARPFSELSFVGTEFDEDGWVTKLPEDDLDTENIKETYTRTKLMQGTLSGAVPNGKYTLLYEGEGKLELGGKAISNVKGLSSNDNTRSFTFDYVLKDSDNPETNSLSVVIRETL
ncbi:MAG: Ig-like domain-containing protein, partial [Cocleimonas sp.]